MDVPTSRENAGLWGVNDGSLWGVDHGSLWGVDDVDQPGTTVVADEGAG